MNKYMITSNESKEYDSNKKALIKNHISQATNTTIFFGEKHES